MEYAVAKKYAEKLCDWLGPVVERVEIAGSIRRLCPRVNDIDLVVIPKVTEEKDLMGVVVSRRNLCLEFLQGYVRERNPCGGKIGKHPYFISGGEREGKQVLMWLAKGQCQLDLWFADAGTWATRLLCRTGSVFHNRWMGDRAGLKGLHWNPYEGLTNVDTAEVVEFEGEEGFYAVLGLGFIEPKNREMEWIQKNLDFGL